MTKPDEWTDEHLRALASRLDELIRASGYKHQAIALRAGQRDTWIADLLAAWRGHGRQGRAPTLPTLMSLAKGLGVPLAELLGPELLRHVEPAETLTPTPRRREHATATRH